MNQVCLLSGHKAAAHPNATLLVQTPSRASPAGLGRGTQRGLHTCVRGDRAPTPTSRSSRTTSVLPYSAASWSAVPVLVWRLISIPALRSCLRKWGGASHRGGREQERKQIAGGLGERPRTRVKRAAGQGTEGPSPILQEGDEEVRGGSGYLMTSLWPFLAAKCRGVV